jgi:hypothetical protein
MIRHTGQLALAALLGWITAPSVAAPFAPDGAQIHVTAGAVTASMPPAPPFTQCPAIGADTSCGVLLYIDTDGSLKALSDPSQGPYDGSDDTLIGIVNSSSKAVGQAWFAPSHGHQITVQIALNETAQPTDPARLIVGGTRRQCLAPSAEGAVHQP